MPEEKKFNPKKDLPHKVIEKQISKKRSSRESEILSKTSTKVTPNIERLLTPDETFQSELLKKTKADYERTINDLTKPSTPKSTTSIVSNVGKRFGKIGTLISGFRMKYQGNNSAFPFKQSPMKQSFPPHKKHEGPVSDVTKKDYDKHVTETTKNVMDKIAKETSKSKHDSQREPDKLKKTKIQKTKKPTPPTIKIPKINYNITKQSSTYVKPFVIPIIKKGLKKTGPKNI